MYIFKKFFPKKKTLDLFFFTVIFIRINIIELFCEGVFSLAVLFFNIKIKGEKMEKFPLTKIGFNALEAELKNLKGVERPNIIAAISEARAQGDLSENAEYSAAKEKQSFIEGRIQDLEAVLSRAQVIDVASVKSNVIRFGATVLVADEDSNEENSYQIVGDYEADIEKNKISLSSPLAKALIGKEVGDVAEFKAPSGNKSFEILEVKYI